MNIFEQSLEILKSKVKVRELFSHLHAEDVKRLVSRVESIYEEKLIEQQEAEEQQARKKEAVQKVIDSMKDVNVTLDDILSLTSEQKKKRSYKPRQKYTFSYSDKDGSEKNWQGALTGRMPDEFADYLSRSGKDRKDCVVSEL